MISLARNNEPILIPMQSSGTQHVWLRRLVGEKAEGFEGESTRSTDELTGNVTQGRGLAHFAEGLSVVYSRMAHALKPGSPLAFTYHHDKIEAYYAIGVAILDAGLTCSASLPCPAEMGDSIHIHGTGSSIVDTVFVCRSGGVSPSRWLFDTPEQLTVIVAEDFAHLTSAGRKPSRGDIHCIICGHLIRMAVWNLRRTWQAELPTEDKLALFAEEVAEFGALERIIELAVSVPANGTQSSPYSRVIVHG